LSDTIKDASAGIEIVDANGNDVPAPFAKVLNATVESKAVLPSTLAAMIVLILKTFPDDVGFASNTFGAVFAGVRYDVFAVIVATFTILGAAIKSSFKN